MDASEERQSDALQTRFQLRGNFPDVDVQVIRDFKQDAVTDNRGRKNKPDCILRIHMDLNFLDDEGVAIALQKLLHDRKHQDLYDGIIQDDSGLEDQRGATVLRAALRVKRKHERAES